MAFDKSLEKVLHKFEIPDNEQYPDQNGTIIEIVSYDGYRPKFRLTRWRKYDSDVERKVVPFCDIPTFLPTWEKICEITTKSIEKIEGGTWKKRSSN